MGYHRQNRVCIMGSCGASNPVDSTLYYWGANPAAGLATTSGAGYMILPENATITEARIISYAATTIGSGESWTWSLRVQGADTVIATTGDTIAQRRWINDNLNIATGTGTNCKAVFKGTTPAWVTNPEGITFYGVLVLTY